MSRLRMDLSHAWRSLTQRRAYFFTCAATLALVLGANASIFAVVSATLLRPLPFAAGERVVRLFALPPGMTDAAQRNPLQQMDFTRFRERSRTMRRIEGFLRRDRVVMQGLESTVVPAVSVTPGLLEMLNVRMQAGRAFLPIEEQPGHAVALVTDGYWRRALGGGSVLDTSIDIDGQPHTIVGILPAGFPPQFLRAEIFTPFAPGAAPTGRNPARSIVTVAELADRASTAAADAETNEIIRQLAGEFPQTHTGWTGGAEPMRQWLYGSVRAPVLMLFAATTVVLLIACANLASLSSAHAKARAADLSLRIALGAGRLDILRLHIAELLIVAGFGLLPGLLLASAAVPALLALDPVAARSLGTVSLDWRVQLFSTAAAALTAIAAAALPAVQVFRASPAGILAETGARASGSTRAVRTRRLLIVTEVALCVALLMAGAVLIRGLVTVTRLQPGYEARGVLTAQVRLPEASYPTHPARVAVVSRILESIRRLPGVVAASTTMNDFVPGSSYQTMFHLEGRPRPDGQPHSTQFRRISPDYFRVMGIRQLRGRAFSEADTADAPAVAIISNRLARDLFPGEDALGRVLRRTAPNAPGMTIVGIVDDVYDVGLTQRPEPTLYLPWSQSSNNGVPVSLVIRTDLEPISLVHSVNEAVRAIDSGLPLRNVQPLETFVADSLAPERFRTTVLGIVAALGLVLAALGIYGVTYRGVVDRTREFAIRLALGAGRGRVVRLVLREASNDVVAGVVAGVFGGLFLCGLLSRLLANVGEAGAMTTGMSVAALVVTAFVAALVPALLVMRVEPAEALRSR